MTGSVGEQLVYLVMTLIGFLSVGVSLIVMLDARRPDSLRYLSAVFFASGLMLGFGCGTMMVLSGLVDIGLLKP